MTRIIEEEDLIDGNRFVCVFENGSYEKTNGTRFVGKIYEYCAESSITLSNVVGSGTVEIYKLKCDDGTSMFNEFSTFNGKSGIDDYARIILAPLNDIEEEELFLCELSNSWECIVEGIDIKPNPHKTESAMHKIIFDEFTYEYGFYWEEYDCTSAHPDVYPKGRSLFCPDQYERNLMRADDKKRRGIKNVDRKKVQITHILR